MSKAPRSIVNEALAADRLGAPSVIAFALTAAAPLMVIGGVVTVGWATTSAVTGITAYPLAFVLMAVILALFTVGYMAMSRRISNAGAFYSYVAQGAGRPAGVGASLIAFVAYNLLQIGLYGIFGFSLQMFLDAKLGMDIPWWVFAMAAWLITSALGVMRVDINGAVLLIIVACEVAVVVVFDVLFLTNPEGGTVSMATFMPENLFLTGVGATLVTVITSFVGFEATAVYSEETKNRERTVPMASYLALGLMVVFYAITSWAISVAVGESNLIGVAQEQQTDMMFLLAADLLSTPWVADAGMLLLLTSVFAAMLSYHNTVARYTFSLAREGVLPKALAYTSMNSGSPRNASLLQSAIAGVVIVLFALSGAEPLTQLFFPFGMSGGFGILLLITATSIAVVCYFMAGGNDSNDQLARPNIWARFIAPAISSIVLLAIVYFAVDSIGPLIGVEPGHPLEWVVPSAFGLIAVIGILWALMLKSSRPDVYAKIGRGADARERADETGEIIPVFVGSDK